VRELPSRLDAAALAEQLLAPLDDRLRHTSAVASRAEELAVTVPEHDRELLIVAAWWHDLGYAPCLAVTGFHSLDGARFLASRGYPLRLCALVAHHSAATFEAEERSLAAELAEWPREESPVADALWMADMTTGPRGEAVDFATRFTEILDRYDSESLVVRAMTRARPAIEDAIRRTDVRLAVR
jgi:putative nucleotidyltransferase with HDIG domain